jgi:release factor glutamine methyltransferase
VPRNETELLVKHSIKLIKKYKIKQIYDLCCGSGNIGLAIKKHASGTNVTCVDMNHSAIENTRHNASKNDVKIKTIIGDFYNSIKSKISCIVCNPPYVNNKKLDKRMLKYEDKISFTNSMDELYFYKKIINNYGKIMKNNFLIIFEIGYDQKKALTKILGKNNLLKYSSFDKDLSGLDRILTIDKY